MNLPCSRKYCYANLDYRRIVWAAVYQLTVGTVCYSLVSEMSTRRLQIKTVVLGRNLYIIVGIIASVLTPYMLNQSAWDWGNYAGFVSYTPSPQDRIALTANTSSGEAAVSSASSTPTSASRSQQDVRSPNLICSLSEKSAREISHLQKSTSLMRRSMRAFCHSIKIPSRHSIPR